MPKHHIEKSIASPEIEGGFPVERETKIKFIGTRQEFEDLMNSLDAELVHKTRMIDDMRFAAGKDFLPSSTLTVKEEVFAGPEGLDETGVISALELLGFSVKKNGHALELVCPADMEKKTVRIRNDGGQWVFTAKRRLDKLDESGYIEEKPEVEIDLSSPAQLLEFLESEARLELDSHRQKLRTSFRLKSGQLVELNESPASETHDLPFWLEIEGKSLSDIENAARQLGYDKSHFFKGSDKKFMMKNGGLSEDETKKILF